MQTTSLPGFRLLLAVVLLVGVAAKVQALPFVLNEDFRGAWNNALTLSSAWRAKDPDKQLVGSANRAEFPGAKGASPSTDDGQLNFLKGDRFLTRLTYTTDLELRYRQNVGIFAKMTAWYDYVGERENVHHGTIANGYVPNTKLDDSDYYSHNKFSGYQLLDLYVYGNIDIGSSRLSGRLGKQKVNWGESLLHLGFNAFNPINLGGLGRPGVRQDDALLPVNRIFGSLTTRNGVSLEAFYALGWERSWVSPCGDFASPADNSFDPGCFGATANLGLSDRQQYLLGRVSEINPEGLLWPTIAITAPGDDPDAHEYGVSLRYFVEPLDTEVGFYYVNYNSTVATLGSTPCSRTEAATPDDPCGPNPFTGYTVPTEYAEDIQSAAISLATGVYGMAITAELSHTHDLPVQRNYSEIIDGTVTGGGLYGDRIRAAQLAAGPGERPYFSGTYKVNRTQLLFGGDLALRSFFGSFGGLTQARLVGEVAAQWNNLPGTDEERIGRSGQWGAAAYEGVCQEATQLTEGGCDVDGFATDFSWGYRLLAIATLPVPQFGLEFKPIMRWFHDVEGYAVDGSQHQGRTTFRLQLNTIFQRRVFLNISRTWINSNTAYDSLRDKDAWTLATGLVF